MGRLNCIETIFNDPMSVRKNMQKSCTAHSRDRRVLRAGASTSICRWSTCAEARMKALLQPTRILVLASHSDARHRPGGLGRIVTWM